MAIPRIRIICVESKAPVAPATIAKVVTIPSLAPYMISPIYLPLATSCHGSASIDFCS
ncbi:MAG: hypothetical protein V3V84_08975 [Candidatus Bathyarchaeia archaeon]